MKPPTYNGLDCRREHKIASETLARRADLKLRILYGNDLGERRSDQHFAGRKGCRDMWTRVRVSLEAFASAQVHTRSRKAVFHEFHDLEVASRTRRSQCAAEHVRGPSSIM